MKAQEIREILKQELGAIAPEVDLDTLDVEEDLRDEMDIDSMDFLRLTVALGKRLNTQIPDEDQGRITTFDSLLSYLIKRSGE